MAQVSIQTIANEIAEIAQSLGYSTKMEPDPDRFRIFGWFRERKFRPDLKVENGNSSAIVVAMPRPVTVYDVLLTHQVRGKPDTGPLICVPEEPFQRIRESAWEYASELGVHLCRLSLVEEELKNLLGEEEAPD